MAQQIKGRNSLPTINLNSESFQIIDTIQNQYNVKEQFFDSFHSRGKYKITVIF